MTSPRQILKLLKTASKTQPKSGVGFPPDSVSRSCAQADRPWGLGSEGTHLLERRGLNKADIAQPKNQAGEKGSLRAQSWCPVTGQPALLKVTLGQAKLVLLISYCALPAPAAAALAGELRPKQSHTSALRWSTLPGPPEGLPGRVS